MSRDMSPIPMKTTTNDESSSLSPEIMNAIYGTVDDKKKAYEESLKRYVFFTSYNVPRHHTWCVTSIYLSTTCLLTTYYTPCRWWTEYADRKNDEGDEYVANSLLYDRNHLPRSAPAPDCCLGGDPPQSSTPDTTK